MKQGFIKLHRELIDHWIFNENIEYTKAQAFIYILLKCNHKKNKILIGGEIVEIDRGSFFTSKKKLQKKFKWGRKKLEKFLELLKNENMSYEKTCGKGTHKGTLLYVLNYSKYQDDEHNMEHNEVHNWDITRDITGTLNKNDKNDKNEKNNNITNDFEKILTKFNELNECNLKSTEKKKKQFQARLKSFSMVEIEKAISNRSIDKFMKGENDQGKIYRKDWDSLFRNDDQVEKWLNREIVSTEDNLREEFKRVMKEYSVTEQNLWYFLINDVVNPGSFGELSPDYVRDKLKNLVLLHNKYKNETKN